MLSYSYIFESTVSSIEERQSIYDFWREDPILLERNSFIAQIYQNFIDDDSEINFHKTIVANYLLESLYFYQGFIYFYSLASRKKMTGVSSIIRYINRDELLHVGIFASIIKELNIDKELIYSMFEHAVNQDIKWNKHILSNILGISNISIDEYTKFLANKRLRTIGLENIYEENNKNPYLHLERMSGIGEYNDKVKSNYFETTVTNYSASSAIDGWDEI